MMDLGQLFATVKLSYHIGFIHFFYMHALYFHTKQKYVVGNGTLPPIPFTNIHVVALIRDDENRKLHFWCRASWKKQFLVVCEKKIDKGGLVLHIRYFLVRKAKTWTLMAPQHAGIIHP